MLERNHIIGTILSKLIELIHQKNARVYSGNTEKEVAAHLDPTPSKLNN